MVSNLPKINVRPSDVLITLAAPLTELLQVAIITEWLLLLHRKLLTNQFTITRRAGKTLAMKSFILKFHSIISSDILVTDATAGCVLP